MILECDFGNSALKWRLVSNTVIQERGTAAYTSQFDFLTSLPLVQITKIRASSVAASQVTEAFAAAVERHNLPVIEWARSSAHCSGVHNAYEEPERLGVDRWLAVVAAYHKYQSAVLVVDAGSALTVDFVDHTGQHSGGYILPGLGLMKEALRKDTSGVLFEGVKPRLGLGHNTLAAVSGGLSAALVGAIQQAVNEVVQHYTQPFVIILTGGDTLFVESLLSSVDNAYIVHKEPELVLDGLALVLP